MNVFEEFQDIHFIPAFVTPVKLIISTHITFTFIDSCTRYGIYHLVLYRRFLSQPQQTGHNDGYQCFQLYSIYIPSCIEMCLYLCVTVYQVVCYRCVACGHISSLSDVSAVWRLCSRRHFKTLWPKESYCS